MSDQQILCSIEERVATITLNRPDVMNAFADGMREALFECLEALSVDAGVGCVVITGAGKAFCAGGDIASMAALQDRNDTSVVEGRVTIAGRVIRQIRAMPQPVIAAVNGAAAGGGANLALACDLRLASDRAMLSESFVKIGLVPDWGGFAFLPRLVGTAKALELMLTGDRVDAETALRLGLFNKVYPAADFTVAVQEFAARLAAGPASTMAAIKRGVYTGVEASLDQVVGYEFEVQPGIFLSGDAREGMRAFLEKRPPRFGKG